MKSGLEGRNNYSRPRTDGSVRDRLNEVRPRRPEQFMIRTYLPRLGQRSQ